MKIVSVAHMKGGVGKTTAAVNLAYLASVAGYKTLLADFDAQGAASFLFRLDPSLGVKAKKVVAGKKSLIDFIRTTDYPGLDLLPSSTTFRKLPELLAGDGNRKEGRKKIGASLERVGKRYDIVFVDPPAGLGLSNEGILLASDLVLVPVVPSPLSMQSFKVFRDFIDSHKPHPEVRAFLSIVDGRKKLHRELVENSFHMTESYWPISVPYSSAVERMTAERVPLPLVTRPGPALESYRELWKRSFEFLAISPVERK